MRTILAASLTLLVIGIGGCGGDSSSRKNSPTTTATATPTSTAYPLAAQREFVRQCRTASPKKFCECVLNRLQRRWPYSHYFTVDAMLRAERDLSDEDARTLTSAQTACSSG